MLCNWRQRTKKNKRRKKKRKIKRSRRVTATSSTPTCRITGARIRMSHKTRTIIIKSSSKLTRSRWWRFRWEESRCHLGWLRGSLRSWWEIGARPRTRTLRHSWWRRAPRSMTLCSSTCYPWKIMLLREMTRKWVRCFLGALGSQHTANERRSPLMKLTPFKTQTEVSDTYNSWSTRCRGTDTWKMSLRTWK